MSAVASSAPLENLQVVLSELHIENCFKAMVYGLEVSEGKPSPQVFLLAAKKLGVTRKIVSLSKMRWPGWLPRRVQVCIALRLLIPIPPRA